MEGPTCTHLNAVHVTQLPDEVEGCEDCLKIGNPWLHLRICLTCGKVGAVTARRTATPPPTPGTPPIR